MVLMYEKHIETLELFFAGCLSKQDPRLDSALPAAIDLMHAAEAAQAENNRIEKARAEAFSSAMHYRGIADDLETKLAAAQAQRDDLERVFRAEHEARVQDARDAETKLAAAQAEIERLKPLARVYTQEEIEMYSRTNGATLTQEAETKLEKLRAAAEHALEENDPVIVRMWIRAAIEASK